MNRRGRERPWKVTVDTLSVQPDLASPTPSRERHEVGSSVVIVTLVSLATTEDCCFLAGVPLPGEAAFD